MTTSVAAGNCESSESDIVHDHIRFRQHQIVAITYIGVRVGALHMKYTGTIESGETVGGSPGGGELSSGGGSTKMIRAARTPIARSCSSASASTSCNRPITKLQDLLGGGRMRRRSAATHADAGAMRWWLTVLQGTPSSVAIWRRVQPSAHSSAARSTCMAYRNGGPARGCILHDGVASSRASVASSATADSLPSHARTDPNVLVPSALPYLEGT